jgi:Cu2+-exporting ATPase
MDHSHHLEPSSNHSDDRGSHMEQHGHHSSMGHAGHDHGAMIKDFKKRFYIVLIITVPIMLLSPMIQHWLNLHWEFMGSNILLSLLSSVVFFYGGWPFLKGWLKEMKDWKPGMMSLIGFAITVAYIYSLATVIGLKGMDFFWELSTLILIMLLGHWIEMRSVAVSFTNVDPKAAATIKEIVDQYLSLKNALANDNSNDAAVSGKSVVPLTKNTIFAWCV